MLDLKVYADAEPDLCLSRRLLRDVRERGRDIEGCIKQWFKFVRPACVRDVEPQRNVAGKHEFVPQTHPFHHHDDPNNA